MIDKECAYYKCHKELEDCTFCYCPIYPCKIKSLGEYVIVWKNKQVWDCSKCDMIHDKRILKKIKKAIKEIIIEETT